MNHQKNIQLPYLQQLFQSHYRNLSPQPVDSHPVKYLTEMILHILPRTDITDVHATFNINTRKLP